MLSDVDAADTPIPRPVGDGKRLESRCVHRLGSP
jgi:hypothetical protein